MISVRNDFGRQIDNSWQWGEWKSDHLRDCTRVAGNRPKWRPRSKNYMNLPLALEIASDPYQSFSGYLGHHPYWLGWSKRLRKASLQQFNIKRF